MGQPVVCIENGDGVWVTLHGLRKHRQGVGGLSSAFFQCQSCTLEIGNIAARAYEPSAGKPAVAGQHPPVVRQCDLDAAIGAAMLLQAHADITFHVAIGDGNEISRHRGAHQLLVAHTRLDEIGEAR